MTDAESEKRSTQSAAHAVGVAFLTLAVMLIGLAFRLKSNWLTMVAVAIYMIGTYLFVFGGEEVHR